MGDPPRSEIPQPSGRADAVPVRVVPDGSIAVIRIAGDLDLAVRQSVVDACTAGVHHRASVDLGETTFMDCAGYGALVTARSILESTGRSLSWINEAGQPAQLLGMIATLERTA